jgi:hypothetical protein
LRYRLTVDVDVDGVVHTGSSVVEVFYQPLPDSLVGIGGGAEFGGEMRGNAITVNLGERGLLFVVDYSPSWRGGGRVPNDYTKLTLLPFTVYDQPSNGLPSMMLGVARELKTRSEPVDVPLKKLPLIGRFKDINDSNSWFEELDPLNLAAAYGAGVRFVDARFEFTNDPISPMPSVWPAWLKASTDSTYRGGPDHLSHPGVGAFKGRQD